MTDKWSSIAWRCCVGTNRFVLWQVRLGTQLHIVLLFSPQTLTLTSLVPSRQLINNTLHPICLRCLVKYSTLCLKVTSFLQWNNDSFSRTVSEASKEILSLQIAVYSLQLVIDFTGLEWQQKSFYTQYVKIKITISII